MVFKWPPSNIKNGNQSKSWLIDLTNSARNKQNISNVKMAFIGDEFYVKNPFDLVTELIDIVVPEGYILVPPFIYKCSHRIELVKQKWMLTKNNCNST